MNTITINNKMPDREADKLAGTLLDESYIDYLVQDDCDVYKPDGTLLMKYRKDVVEMDVCGVAWKSLRGAAGKTSNRGAATGLIEGRKTTKMRMRRRDGSASNTVVAGANVESGVIGYMDRYIRMPYCRMTAFNIDHYKEFAAALPFVYAVNDVFKTNAPDRYQAQLAMVEKTSPDFYIKNTVFTTVTVNKTFRTAVHKDKGDYKDGFGCMAVLEAGKYEGAYLVFPAFRVAVDMRTRGVCLADVHEWHGNTEIKGTGAHERISTIFYYRANMIECGTAEEELEIVKRRKAGDHLKGKR